MNEYANILTGATVTDAGFRALFPDVVFPDLLDTTTLLNYGFAPVVAAPAPTVLPTQYAVRNGAISDPAGTGNWIMNWSVVDMTEDQIVAALSDAQLTAWNAIQDKRSDLEQNGGVLVNNMWFQTDDNSKVKYLTLQAFGPNIPSGTLWKLMDGTFFPMTQELVSALVATAAQTVQLIYTTAEIHREAMMASDDPASYDFSRGWPISYDTASVVTAAIANSQAVLAKATADNATYTTAIATAQAALTAAQNANPVDQNAVTGAQTKLDAVTRMQGYAAANETTAQADLTAQQANLAAMQAACLAVQHAHPATPAPTPTPTPSP